MPGSRSELSLLKLTDFVCRTSLWSVARNRESLGFRRPGRRPFGTENRSKGLFSVRLSDRRGRAGECLTRNVRVPVHKRAVGILLPRPDMQGVERRQAKAIGAVE